MTVAKMTLLFLCAVNLGLSVRQDSKTKLDEPVLDIEDSVDGPIVLVSSDEDFGVQVTRVWYKFQDREEMDDFRPTYGVHIKEPGMAMVSAKVMQDAEVEWFEWYVHAGNGKHCGIGLYTTSQETLSCDNNADDYDEVEELTTNKGAPSERERAFGLELELVARHFEVGEVTNTEENEGKQRVDKLKSCFESVVSGKFIAEPAQKWEWIWDHTVHPVGQDQIAAISKTKVTKIGQALAKEASTEASGNPFEVISPPLSGKSDAKQCLLMLATLKNMGIQAPLSAGMHVHVNAASSKVPGEPLTVRQVAQVWVAFVKYQLVIDEMMQPSRIFNKQTRSYYLGKADQLCKDSEKANDVVCLTGTYFKQVFAFVEQSGDGKEEKDYLAFCNAALKDRMNGQTPCGFASKIPVYGSQREWALNLVSLAKHGTLEFRNHAATTDLARVWYWLQFTIGFVEHFGRGEGESEAKAYLTGSNAETQLKNLAKEQESATLDKLFDQLQEAGLVADDAKEYYRKRVWERTSNQQPAPGCDKFEAKEYHGWGVSPTDVEG